MIRFLGTLLPQTVSLRNSTRPTSGLGSCCALVSLCLIQRKQIVLAKTLFDDITKSQKVYRIPLNTFHFHTLAKLENWSMKTLQPALSTVWHKMDCQNTCLRNWCVICKRENGAKVTSYNKKKEIYIDIFHMMNRLINNYGGLCVKSTQIRKCIDGLVKSFLWELHGFNTVERWVGRDNLKLASLQAPKHGTPWFCRCMCTTDDIAKGL